MGKYDFKLDLQSDNSNTLILNRIKRNTKILEFGCANGRMTKYLKETLNCCVDIVEIDEESGKEASLYANLAFLGNEFGNIENFKFMLDLPDEKYDYIVFADVLEHLKEPQIVLSRVKRLLKNDGSVLLSVPNIAHNSVIIDLLNNRFKYSETGLLDKTHIHFFSYDSLKQMIKEAGYEPILENATYANVGENEILNNYNSLSPELQKELKKRDMGTVYQFVFELKKPKCAFGIKHQKVVNLSNKFNYKCVCYILDNDGTYSENKKVEQYIVPGQNILEFDLSSYGNIKGFRLDPIDSNCIVNIKNFYLKIDNKKINIDIQSLKNNGIIENNNIFIFPTNDPQIYIDLSGDTVLLLHMEIEFLDYSTDYISQYLNIFSDRKNLLNSLIDFDKLKKEYEINKSNYDNLHDKFYTLKEENGKIKDENSKIKDENSKIKDENSKIKDENNKIKDENNKIKDENNKIKDENNKIKDENNKIKDEKNQVDSAYNSLLDSKSFRITKPLRGVGGIIKKIKKKF